MYSQGFELEHLSTILSIPLSREKPPSCRDIYNSPNAPIPFSRSPHLHIHSPPGQIPSAHAPMSPSRQGKRVFLCKDDGNMTISYIFPPTLRTSLYISTPCYPVIDPQDTNMSHPPIEAGETMGFSEGGGGMGALGYFPTLVVCGEGRGGGWVLGGSSVVQVILNSRR